MKDKDFEELRKVALFSPLSDARLRDLTHGALLQRFPESTRLFEQGEIPDFLHVLLSGAVQLIGSSQDGRETVVEILRPVDVFILAAVLTSSPYLMSAKVLKDARVLLLPAPVFRQNLLEDPRLAMTMLASLSGQFRVMVRQVKNLKLRTSTQRLGCYLLSLSRGRPGIVELPYKKVVIASHLGITPEALSRSFSQLAQFGIEVRGHTVIISDPATLRAYCLPDSLIDNQETDLHIHP